MIENAFDAIVDFFYIPFVAFVSVVTLILALIAGVILGLNAWEYSMDQSSCRVFGEQSGRQVRFVEYNYWRRDCLTPQPDGHWISTYNLRGVNES